MAHIDFAFVQQIFDISKRKWKTDVQHHCQADDFRRCLEVTKGVWFSHDPTLENRPARLKPFYSENALILHARLAELSQPRKGFACRATGLVLGTKRCCVSQTGNDVENIGVVYFPMIRCAPIRDGGELDVPDDRHEIGKPMAQVAFGQLYMITIEHERDIGRAYF
jgi:hypothetical protein